MLMIQRFTALSLALFISTVASAGQVEVLAAEIIGGAGLTALILYRESAAEKVGEIGQRWYNGMAGGRWKFPEAEGLGIKLVEFRAQVMGTVKSRWFPATVVTLLAQAIFFIALVLSMRRPVPNIQSMTAGTE